MIGTRLTTRRGVTLVVLCAAGGLVAAAAARHSALPLLVWPLISGVIAALGLHWVNLVPVAAIAGANAKVLQFERVLDNMSQGVSFFDGASQLILCNRRYLELFDLPPEIAVPGVTLAALIEYRATVGAVPDMSNEEFVAFLGGVMSSDAADSVIRYRNGRMIASKHRPMPGGGLLATHEDVTVRHDAEARVAHLAAHDPMTGLANRARLQTHLAALRASAAAAAILVLDLDRFKAVNDGFGHSVGDALLCSVAERLRGCVRETDLVVRLGGDEFAIVQSDVEQPRQAEALAQRVVARLGAPYEIGGERLSIGVSIGIAVLNEAAAADAVLHAADVAMYEAKAAAGDGVGHFALFRPEMATRFGRNLPPPALPAASPELARAG